MPNAVPFSTFPSYPQPYPASVGPPISAQSYPPGMHGVISPGPQPGHGPHPGYLESLATQGSFSGVGQPPYPFPPGYMSPPQYPQGPLPYAGHPAQGHPATPSGYPTAASVYPVAALPYPASATTFPGASFGNPQPYPNTGTAPMPQQGKTVHVKTEPDEPTLRPFPSFNREQDAKNIHAAVKGSGTDEKVIIDTLANRSCDQRLQISSAYKNLYGKDLVKRLKSELSGKLADVAMALMQTQDVFYAYSLREAIVGLGTDDATLIEIICSRTNAELAAIKNAYKAEFKKSLEKDVQSDTSGVFKRILVACLAGTRSEGQVVDLNQAKADAEALFKAGPKSWRTDESMFVTIFATRSYAQLLVTFEEFRKVANMDIEKCLTEEMSGNAERSFLALVKIIKNKPGYFAELLHQTIGSSRSEVSTRIIVTRCEKDLGNIKKEFQRMFGQPLSAFISKECSGDYKKILLALIE